MPVWPLKWLLGRTEAETAGQFASRVETGKGKNCKTSVVLEGSSLSPDMQFAKPFHPTVAGFLMFPWLKSVFIRVCSCQDCEGEVSCLTRDAAHLSLSCLLGKCQPAFERSSLFLCGTQLIKSSFGGHIGGKPIYFLSAPLKCMF